MNKKRVILIPILIIAIVLTLIFIWGNSVLSVTRSSSVSGGLYKSLAPFFDKVFGEGVITHAVFRKMAHFGEFFVLGLELFFLIFALDKNSEERLVYTVVFGLFCALVDEGLQVFSKRGSSILDVFVDFLGVVVASLFLYGICKILSKKNKKPLD